LRRCWCCLSNSSVLYSECLQSQPPHTELDTLAAFKLHQGFLRIHRQW
jgi:hypothetical protein